MKRSIMFSIVLLSLFGVAMAEGRQETPAYPYGSRWNQEGYVEPELITVTGTVGSTNQWTPTLTSDGVEYLVMVPRHYLYSANLEQGQTVTVEGYLMSEDWCPVAASEDEKVIHVTKAVVDGNEYDLATRSRGPNSAGMMGRGAGTSGTATPRGRMPRGGRW